MIDVFQVADSMVGDFCLFFKYRYTLCEIVMLPNLSGQLFNFRIRDRLSFFKLLCHFCVCRNIAYDNADERENARYYRCYYSFHFKPHIKPFSLKITTHKGRTKLKAMPLIRL